MYDQTEVPSEKADYPRETSGALQRIDQEIERYEKALGTLADRLSPIVSVYDGPEASMKELAVEPASQLRGRAERLASVTARLDRLIRDIDL